MRQYYGMWHLAFIESVSSKAPWTPSTTGSIYVSGKSQTNVMRLRNYACVDKGLDRAGLRNSATHRTPLPQRGNKVAGWRVGSNDEIFSPLAMLKTTQEIGHGDQT